MSKVNVKSKPARMGRPTYDSLGLAARTRKVLASFTEDEYEELQRAAERSRVTVAALVAARAVFRSTKARRPRHHSVTRASSCQQ